MIETMTRAEAEKLPVFEATPVHQLGTYYLWSRFTDEGLTFFVRPAAQNELGCIADVFGIRDGVTSFIAREMFIREGKRLRLLEEA
ncbi:hypothetical protein OG840_02225 [Streptomyces sp. NBC_01764]|uniref:hypothetical protein n=1 Tax=Streptomyces sp. NBC_01764 TaxID=2975935 RepID=UPI00224EE7F5|nr:hypothetical protein [Streptomyces sp. NBC_01764]MCX4400644.1 hypothetical protein [Streptomyces sp. NBC_01764]